ncbi:dipeptidase [Mycena vulgaris]|nr:dipeptidase [Mycena vulgaris]
MPLGRNGLGDSWDPIRPRIDGIDLTKPDPRLRFPNIEIREQGTSIAVAFINVNILDSTGTAPYLGDVLVEGQRIVKVGGKLSSEELHGVRMIEGRGRALMSGMVDAHAHFSWTNAATGFSTIFNNPMCLSVGAASARERLEIAIKNAIQRGDIPGPRFLANGKEMAPAAGALIGGITRFVETKEDIERAVNEFVDMGIDQCKFSMSGDEITEHLRAEVITFPDELVAASVEAAHARGIRVCSHACSDEAIMQCLQYGADIIYHASFISDAAMDALEAQKDPINMLIATLQDAEPFGYTVSKAEAAGFKRELESAIAGLKEMHRRGIKTPHGTYRDPEHFVELLGMTPMEAIISATAYGGELMRHPNELGKIVPGAYADPILINGNPLEDINLLAQEEFGLSLSLFKSLLQNGRVHKHDKLECETCGR